MIKEIEIPDNCDFIIENNKIIIKEKKEKIIPKSWKEFCEKFPIRKGEAFIDENGCHELSADLFTRTCPNWCTSIEEAEAFLAFIQLRQLRKTLVGDWKEQNSRESYGIINTIDDLIVGSCNYYLPPLSFPTKKMAEDFLECFKDLCETAKILL